MVSTSATSGWVVSTSSTSGGGVGTSGRVLLAKPIARQRSQVLDGGLCVGAARVDLEVLAAPHGEAHDLRHAARRRRACAGIEVAQRDLGVELSCLRHQSGGWPGVEAMRVLDLDDGGLTPGRCIHTASRHILDAQRRSLGRQRLRRLGGDVGG